MASPKTAFESSANAFSTPISERVWRYHTDSVSQNQRFRRYVLTFQVLADFCAIVVGLLASFAYSQPFQVLSPHSWRGVVIAVNLMAFCTCLLFRHFQLYDQTTSLLNIRESENLLRGLGLAFAAGIMVLYFLHLTIPHSLLALSFLLTVALVLSERTAAFLLLRWAHLRGYGIRRILVYGVDQGTHVFRKLAQSPRLGVSCVGFIDDDPGLQGFSISEHFYTKRNWATVLGTWNDVGWLIPEYRVDEIVVADAHVARERLAGILDQSNRAGISVGFLPDLFGQHYSTLELQDLDGISIAKFRSNNPSRSNAFIKRAFDIAATFGLLLLAAPLLTVLAILVKFDSDGQVIFRQQRIGFRGKPFNMFKFRTMWADSPKYAVTPASASDPRITRIGRFLRKTSLDELPQLFNVLIGDMSLVGPRPEMPFIVAKYGNKERRRLDVKPGITGLWQISADRGVPIHENIEYDFYYIEHQNLILDLVILAHTVVFAVRGIGAC